MGNSVPNRYITFKFLDSVFIDERLLSAQHIWMPNKRKSRYIQTQLSVLGRMNHIFEIFLDMIIHRKMTRLETKSCPYIDRNVQHIPPDNEIISRKYCLLHFIHVKHS